MTRLKRKKDVPGNHDLDVRFGTPREVAQHRAARLCEGADTIVEVGAGAGFQTAAFAARAKKVIAVDIDEERLSRGAFAGNVIVIPGDALDPTVIARVKGEVEGTTRVFLDPERPPKSTSRSLDEIQPPLRAFVDAYKEISPSIAIELPPFLAPAEIPWGCEREYLSVDGQLNRLTVYLGDLRTCDVRVVALPRGETIAYDGETLALTPGVVRPRFVLELDRAIVHAGLAPLVLPHPYAPLGKAFLTEHASGWAASYRIVAHGERADAERALARFGSVVVHGPFTPVEQRALQKDLNASCKGRSRADVFVGARWYVTERA